MAQDNPLQRMYEQLGGIGPVQDVFVDPAEAARRVRDSESVVPIDALRSALKETARREWSEMIAQINQDVTDNVLRGDFLSARVFANLSSDFWHSLNQLLLHMDSDHFAERLQDGWQKIVQRLKESVLAETPKSPAFVDDLIWPPLGKAKVRATRRKRRLETHLEWKRLADESRSHESVAKLHNQRTGENITADAVRRAIERLAALEPHYKPDIKLNVPGH